MEIKYKLYPYPVLSSYSNDYGTGAFDVAIDIVRDGYDLRIDFLATLTCQSLQDCIKQGVSKVCISLGVFADWLPYGCPNRQGQRSIHSAEQGSKWQIANLSVCCGS